MGEYFFVRSNFPHTHNIIVKCHSDKVILKFSHDIWISFLVGVLVSLLTSLKSREATSISSEMFRKKSP